jgi:hypothetical protein
MGYGQVLGVGKITLLSLPTLTLTDFSDTRGVQMEVDFTVFSDGPHPSIYLLTPHTTAARAWLDENVQAESYQFIGTSLAVEHRFIAQIVEGIIAAGMEVR